MMAGFIEELFYGKVDLQTRSRKNHCTGKVLSRMNEIEEKLSERLQGEEKDMFLDFCNAYAELMCDTELESFTVGFRFGANVSKEAFRSQRF